MHTTFKFLAFSILFLVLSNCNINNTNTSSTNCFDEYVFAVQLDDTIPGRMQEYLNYHKNVWPEVESGFKKAGYENIKLYRYNNFVCMIVQVPKGKSLEEIGNNPALHTEKVNTWNALMDGFQKGLPGTKPGSTWVAMEKYYEFNNR